MRTWRPRGRSGSARTQSCPPEPTSAAAVAFINSLLELLDAARAKTFVTVKDIVGLIDLMRIYAKAARLR